MQIVPDVYLINGYPYGRHQNGYLIKAPEALLVIDSGDMEDDSFDTVSAACRRWGYAVEQVTHLLVTHAHFDHASHAARFRRFGAKIIASADTADAMAAGDDRCIGYAMSRAFEPCATDIIAEDGKTLELGGLVMRPIEAPGHTNGLMVFDMMVRGERLWCCGDLLKVGTECASVELGWPGSPDLDRPLYLDTLRRLVHLPPCDILLPGHGPAGIGVGKRLVDMAYAKAMQVRWTPCLFGRRTLAGWMNRGRRDLRGAARELVREHLQHSDYELGPRLASTLGRTYGRAEADLAQMW